MSRTVRLSVDAEIRPATLRDLPSLATWSGQVNAVFGPALERDDRVLLVALANGRFPIGHALIDLSGIISHLLVLGGFRDQGLGAALIDEGEKVLREAGVIRSTLMVEKANDGAIRLYERLGYTRSGETAETWPDPMPDGTVQPVAHPSWVMQKQL
ncbi:MAG: GNAT family N-acetyltransferase [Chloroflexi bacterium]|nr:MAG: GNAT family N-acetyltransferase [Chloroflexota bacterium]